MGTAQSYKAPAPNPNPSPPVKTMSPVAWIATVIAVLGVIAIFVFVYLNRSRAFGRAPQPGGCRVRDVTLPDHIDTKEDHDKANASMDVIVVHHSKNCGYCQKFKPVVINAADEMGLRVVFSEIGSSSANQEMFGRLPDVNGVPAYTLNGKMLGLGYRSKADLVPLLKQAMG